MPDGGLTRDEIAVIVRALYGETLGRIDERLVAVNRTLSEIRQDFAGASGDQERANSGFDRRLADLERQVWKLLALGAGAGLVAGLIADILHLAITIH